MPPTKSSKPAKQAKPDKTNSKAAKPATKSASAKVAKTDQQEDQDIQDIKTDQAEDGKKVPQIEVDSPSAVDWVAESKEADDSKSDPSKKGAKRGRPKKAPDNTANSTSSTYSVPNTPTDDTTEWENSKVSDLDVEQILKVLINRGLQQKNPVLSIGCERVYCQLNRIPCDEPTEEAGEMNDGYPRQGWNRSAFYYSADNPYNNTNPNTNPQYRPRHQRAYGGYGSRPPVGVQGGGYQGGGYTVPINRSNNRRVDGPVARK